jgi:hypothetical protein
VGYYVDECRSVLWRAWRCGRAAGAARWNLVQWGAGDVDRINSHYQLECSLNPHLGVNHLCYELGHCPSYNMCFFFFFCKLSRIFTSLLTQVVTISFLLGCYSLSAYLLLRLISYISTYSLLINYNSPIIYFYYNKFINFI